MSTPPYVVRAVRPTDFEDFQEIRELAGPGFTSLLMNDAQLRERLEVAAAAFTTEVAAPGKERYLLALEHTASGRVVGCCQVKATVGDAPPFFNFRILRVAQASAAADRRFDLDVLILVNEFFNCTEVGSLFLRPEHRVPGLGRALAQSRYLLMAAEPHRFNDRVVSELRGVVSEDGVSPFWEALGRHFFRMDFNEADRLSATTDNQFILDLMPKYPIYVDLLPQEARDVIGKTHAHGRGARSLLEWEGFRFDNVVDIFDGGPLLSVSRDAIRTSRKSRRVRVEADETLNGARRGLMANPEIARYACAMTRFVIDGDKGQEIARADTDTLKSLGLEPGAEALIWSDDAS